jgi:hypothetical protein
MWAAHVMNYWKSGRIIRSSCSVGTTASVILWPQISTQKERRIITFVLSFLVRGELNYTYAN